MPKDRLSVSKHVNKDVIPLIQQKKYLGLEKETSSRSNLFIYAMALGVKLGYPTDLGKGAEGIVLLKSVEAKDMSEIRALWVSEKIENKEFDQISNTDGAITLAEQYANTGFLEIEKQLTDENFDETQSLYDEIEKLQDEFQEIFSNE